MKTKRILSVLLTLAMVIGILSGFTITSSAKPLNDVCRYLYPVYIDDDVTKGIKEWQTGTKDSGEYELFHLLVQPTVLGETGQTTWYQVNSDALIEQTLTILGDVHLVLKDGVTLSVNADKTNGSSYAIFIDSGSSLTIYGEEENTGRIMAKATCGDGNPCGIMSHGTLTINGGIIDAFGVDYEGDGICIEGAAEATIFNGGTVTAVGGDCHDTCGGSGLAKWTDADVIVNGGDLAFIGGLSAYQGENPYTENGIYANNNLFVNTCMDIFAGDTEDPTTKVCKKRTSTTDISNEAELKKQFVEIKPAKVAKIGSDTYATVGDALAAEYENEDENNPTVITLIGDATENVTIANDRNITLDLNGYVLTSNNDVSPIYNCGKLTIKDSAPTEAHYFNYIKNGAWTLNTAATSGIEISDITAKTADNTAVKVNGGVITGTYRNDTKTQFAGIYNESCSTLTVNDGVNIVGFKVQHSAIYNVHANLTVNKANIVGNTAYSGAGIKNYNGTATVGTISGNDSDVLIAYNTTTSNGQFGDGGGGIYNILATRTSTFSEDTTTETAATLTINHANIRNNKSAYKGGGISNAIDKTGSATVTMNGGVITDNESVHNGGGVSNYTHNASGQAVFTMNGGKISGNKAIIREYDLVKGTASGGNGGGVANNGTFSIVGSTSEISGNEAVLGGGIYTAGALNILDGSVKNNKANIVTKQASAKIPAGYVAAVAAREGLIGGVYNDNGTFTMIGGEITGNTADNNIGGVFDEGDATVTVGGTAKISGNKHAASLESNLIIPYGKTVGIATGDNAPAECMQIGITILNEEKNGTTIGNFSICSSADNALAFTSDNEIYKIIYVEATTGETPTAAHLEVVKIPVTLLEETSNISLEDNNMTSKRAIKIVTDAIKTPTENSIVAYSLSGKKYSCLIFDGAEWTSLNTTKTISELKTAIKENNAVSVYVIGTISASSNKSSGGGSRVSTVKVTTINGETSSSQNIVIGKKISSIAKPEIEKKIFTGWFENEELTVLISEDNVINKETKLYAGFVWNPKYTMNLYIGKLEAKVFGEDKTNDVAPVIQNDRTMLPARFVAENLGAKVEWNEKEQKVTILSEDKKTEIIIYVDSDIAYVNGKEVKLDSPAYVKNDRTFTPQRFIAETLGATVEWVDKNQEVIIIK